VGSGSCVVGFGLGGSSAKVGHSRLDRLRLRSEYSSAYRVSSGSLSRGRERMLIVVLLILFLRLDGTSNTFALPPPSKGRAPLFLTSSLAGRNIWSWQLYRSAMSSTIARLL